MKLNVQKYENRGILPPNLYGLKDRKSKKRIKSKLEGDTKKLEERKSRTIRTGSS
jgi:hypothetical protein